MMSKFLLSFCSIGTLTKRQAKHKRTKIGIKFQMSHSLLSKLVEAPIDSPIDFKIVDFKICYRDSKIL